MWLLLLFMANSRVHQVAVSLLLWRGIPQAIQSAVFQPFSQYGGGHTALGTSRVTWSSAFTTSWGVLSSLVPPDDMVNWILVDVKHGDSSVMIGYQVDQFTHTWLLEYFVLSNIYLGFMGKMSTLTYFLLEPGYEDCSFLTKLLQALSMILNPFSLSLLKHQNWILPLMSLMPWLLQSLQGSVSTISDISKLQLVPSIKSH